jgi:hypothetical protein
MKMMKFAPNTEGLPPKIRKFLLSLPKAIADQIDEIGFWEHRTGSPGSGPTVVLHTPRLTDAQADKLRIDFAALDGLSIVDIFFRIDNA